MNKPTRLSLVLDIAECAEDLEGCGLGTCIFQPGVWYLVLSYFAISCLASGTGLSYSCAVSLTNTATRGGVLFAFGLRSLCGYVPRVWHKVCGLTAYGFPTLRNCVPCVWHKFYLRIRGSRGGWPSPPGSFNGMCYPALSRAIPRYVYVYKKKDVLSRAIPRYPALCICL